MYHARDATLGLRKVGQSGHRSAVADIDFCCRDVVPGVSQVCASQVELGPVEIGEDRNPAGAKSAGDRQSHPPYSDDDEDV